MIDHRLSPIWWAHLAIGPWLLLLCLCGPLAAQTNNANAIMFDEYFGTLISARSNVLKIQTSEGEKVFRIVSPREDLPPLGVGRSTAISIKGVDRISFLSEGMIVRLDASLDSNRRGSVPITELHVVSLDAREKTSKDRISEPDPNTGVATYRITARIQSIEDEGRQLGLIARNGNRSERFEVIADPETTQVHYNLPNLSLAKEGESVTVRCLPVQTPTLIASEIRIERPNPFAEIVAGDTPDAPPDAEADAESEAEAEPEERNPLAQMAETEPDPDERDEGFAGHLVDEGDDDLEGMAEENPGDDEKVEAEAEDADQDVVEFDFEQPADENSQIDHGVLRVVLGLVLRDEVEDLEQPVGPAKLDRSSEPRKTRPGRTWYKIN